MDRLRMSPFVLFVFAELMILSSFCHG
jgi:hypothetical protein